MPPAFKLLLLLCLTLCASAQADVYSYFIRYQAEPELARIVIRWEELRGRRGVDHFDANREAYAAADCYTTQGPAGEGRVITKVEQMEGHEIQTELHIRYPRGHGFGGACSWNSIKVYFDGVLQLDTPFGYDHASETTVAEVLIHPAEELIQVNTRGNTDYHFIEPTKGEPLRLP
jgi:hypothetical protein